MKLIHQKSGTYAETLEAIGVASLLRECGFEQVELKATGGGFRIVSASDPAVRLNDWSRPNSGLVYVWDKEKELQRPDVVNCLDYKDEREKETRWFEYVNATRKAKKKVSQELSEQGLEEPPKPDRNLKLAKMLASMRKGWSSDSDLAKWIDAGPDGIIEWIQHSLGFLPDAPNNITVPDVSSTQVLNPIAGKGISAPKTSWRAPNSPPDALIDTFAEWMKLRGMWCAMIACRSDQDFKFFVIEPKEIPVETLRSIRDEMEDLNLWGGVRLDIESTLRLTELLIRKSEFFQGEIRIYRRRPNEIITGLRQAFFKSLGTAAALMNDALLPLPEWFAIESRQDCEDYLQIIDEFIGTVEPRSYGCLGALDPDKSDEGEILQAFREWLNSGELSEFLNFHYSFSLKMIQKIAAGSYASLFSTQTLDLLLKKTYQEKHQVKDILENSGFQSVARAIRNSTVYAVSLSNSNREIHFGLAQKWKQKLGDPPRLKAEIGRYVQEQNWEVVHKLEGRGHQVTTEDLDQLFALIDQHGSELVGSLLLAYGYSRAPKTESSNPENTGA